MTQIKLITHHVNQPHQTTSDTSIKSDLATINQAEVNCCPEGY